MKEIKIEKVKVLAKIEFMEGADMAVPIDLLDKAAFQDSGILGYVVQIQIGEFSSPECRDYVIDQFGPDQQQAALDKAIYVRKNGVMYAENGVGKIHFIP